MSFEEFKKIEDDVFDFSLSDKLLTLYLPEGEIRIPCDTNWIGICRKELVMHE
jgi:hypothetical protein